MHKTESVISGYTLLIMQNKHYVKERITSTSVTAGNH